MKNAKISFLLLPLVVFPTLALKCGGDASSDTGTIVTHGCVADQVVSYPGEVAEGDFYVEKPAECPISFSTPGTNFEFSARGEFAPSTFWGHDPDAQLDITNANGTIVKETRASSWTAVNPDPASCTIDCPTHDVIYLGDLYPAGTAGFQSANEDQADIRLFMDGSLWHRYIGHLPYQYNHPLDVVAPAEVMPNTSFDIDASLHDLAFVSPVYWGWSDNGQVIRNGSSHYTDPGSPMGTMHNFEITASDDYGHSVSQTVQVWTKTCDTPGCHDQ